MNSTESNVEDLIEEFPPPPSPGIRLLQNRRVRQIYTRIRLTHSELQRLERQFEDVPEQQPGHGSSGEHVSAHRRPANISPDVAACYNYLGVALSALGWMGGEEWSSDLAGYEDIVSAYQALFAAKRELMYLRFYAAKSGRDESPPAEGQTKLSAEDHVLRREATKILTRAEDELSGWPWFIILKMLTEDGGKLRPPDHLDIDTVVDARQIYDEQALKQLDLVDTLERQYGVFVYSAGLGILAIVLLVLVAPYIASLLSWISGWIAFRDFTSGNEILRTFGELSWQYGSIFYLAVALFGLLGASISGLLTLRGVSTTTKTLHSTISLGRLAYARVYTGVGSALVLVALIEAGLLDLVLQVPVEFKEPPGPLVVAFFSGFSERLLAKAVVEVTGDEAESDISSLLRYQSRADGSSKQTGDEANE